MTYTQISLRMNLFLKKVIQPIEEEGLIVVDDILLIIGGPQGSGLETSAIVLTRAFAEGGYTVVADREYHSNIKGKHSYTHMRISVRNKKSLKYPVDIVVAMDAETVFTHFQDVSKGGYFIVDENISGKVLLKIASMEFETKKRLEMELKKLGITGDHVKSILNYLEDNGVNVLSLNYLNFLKEISQKYELNLLTASRYLSAIAVDVITALTSIEEEYVFNSIKIRLAGKEEIIKHNIELIGNVVKAIKDKVGSPLKLVKPSPRHSEVMVVTGNDIVAMGKIVGGLRLQTYYLITPAADESFYLESKEVLKIGSKILGGIVVFQTEDEIAAIVSAIGGALAGARTATATSGPGFSLMVEGLGWAGITETPVVITYYQRGGPSTGMPTRGAQSDLFFTMFSGHGEFSKIVLASGDHLEAFYDAVDAFNFAEKYQLPVIHLIDKFLANSTSTVSLPDFSKIFIDRGKIVKGKAGYKRFDKNDTITLRAFLGSNTIMWYTGNEHDEYGHVSENPINRIEMYEKRIKKLEIADREIPVERRVKLYGYGGSRMLLVGWRSVKGPVLDAIERLGDRDVSYLHIRMFSPFPKDYIKNILEQSTILVAVEHSYDTQIAKLVKLFTGIEIKNAIVKYTGRPIYENEMVHAISKIFSERVEKVVLSYGE